MFKRRALSVQDKVEIIKLLENGEKNVTVCKKFGLSSSTVSTLRKNKESLLKAFESNLTESKRLKRCEKEDLDKALLKWFIQKRESGLPINGPIMKIQAEQLAVKLGYQNFTCSNGWLHRFKKRHSISLEKSLCAEIRETSKWLDTVWKDLCKNYHADDIYNADETVFYNLSSNLAMFDEKCIEEKLMKHQLTVLVCSNMSGSDKRQLLVIGNTPATSFGSRNFPVTYESNETATMTSEIFTTYLQEWDVELQKIKRKVLLIVDSCPMHPFVEDITNIKLVLLPSNSATVLQPMNQGIIRTLKSRCHQELILMLLDRKDNSKETEISVPDAIQLIANAWESLVPSCIQNCFKNSGWDFSDGYDSQSGSFDECEDNLSDWLLQKHIEYSNDVNAKEFVHEDDVEVNTDIDSLKNDIKLIESHHDNDETIDVVISNPPSSFVSALESVQKLEHFFQSVDKNDNQVFNALSVLRKKIMELKNFRK